MNVFSPTLLTKVVQVIQKEHPLDGQLQTELPTNTLHDLVFRITELPPDEVELFAALLTSRQRQSLCRYLATNSFRVPLDNIIRILEVRLDSGSFTTLFLVWQKYPDCMPVLRLLGKYDGPPVRPAHFPVQEGLLRQWSTADQPLDAVIRSAARQKKNGTFEARFSAMGLAADSLLYLYTFRRFLCQASGNDFAMEGDQRISRLLLQPSSRQSQQNILLRLLFCAQRDHDLLTSFDRTYSIALNLWGPAESETFPPNLPHLRAVYQWWQNYHQLSHAFTGDSRRIAYWKQYLHLCTCIRNARHKMLIFRFPEYVVTEFEDVGPVYLFTAAYYDREVARQLHTSNTTNLKSWLYKCSAHLSRETHTIRWEWNQNYALRKNHVIP